MTDTSEKIREILKQKSVFGNVPDAALDDLVKRGRIVRYAKGDAVYHRGDAGDSLMVILSGRIKIFNVASSSREVVLNFLGAGDLSGEFSALDGESRSADAAALEPTTALLLFRRDILPVLERHPQAMLGVVMVLTKRLRLMTAMAEHNLLQMSAKAASGLLRLAEQHGREAADGVLLDLKLSQRDLGNYLGLSRENTSRELGRLKDQGLIRVDGAQVTIVDLDGLRDAAEVETE